MKTETARFGLILALMAASLAGCASHSQQNANAAPTQAAMAEHGADMQKAGVMTQSDYVRADTLAHTVSHTHTISEADLNWTLTQLKTETSSVARARAFNTLAAIDPMSHAQKAQILPAVSPYQNNSDQIDQLGAQKVEKAAQAGG